MSDWRKPWPETNEPPRYRPPRKRTRVRFREFRGTVIDTWRSPRGFDNEGEWWARVQLDRGPRITVLAKRLEVLH